MEIQHLGHACLRVTAGDASLLLDPGVFSPGLDSHLGDGAATAAVLVTHAHPDHLDPDLVPLLEHHAGVGGVRAEAGAADVVQRAGGTPVVLMSRASSCSSMAWPRSASPTISDR